MKKIPWYYLPVALLLSFIAAAIQAYSFPPHKFGFLGWVALLPLIAVARFERPAVGCLCGLVTALVCGKICGGQWEEASQYGNLIAGFGSFGIVLAFTMVVASLSSKRVSAALWPFVVAAAGVTGELIGTALFPVSVSLSQYQNTVALHLASVTGVWGVSFLLWLVPSALVVSYPRLKHAVPGLAVAAVVLVAALVPLVPPTTRGPSVMVTAVQAPGSFDAFDVTARIKGRSAIVVWPEHCLKSTNLQLWEAAKSAGTYLVASFSEPGKFEKPYNASFVFSPSGERIAVFRKQHLFGKEVFHFTPGRPSDPVRTGSFLTAAPVCFDTEFTGVTRDYVRRGAELIAVPNHDPVLPSAMFNYLHMAVIPFRAAENGVPIVWAECRGLSSIVDSNGRIVAQAPVDAVTSVTARVHLRNRTTIFTRFGDYFAYLCAAAVAVTLLSIIRGMPSRRPVLRSQD